MKRIIVIFILFIINLNAEAEKISSKQTNILAITAGNAYFGLKYNVISRLSMEVRSSFDTGVILFSGRLNYVFFKIKRLNIYSGFETGYILFNYNNIRGKGWLFSPFAGIEYFVIKKLSVLSDIGYTIINLTSHSISVTGPEIILNLGINYYIF